MVGCAKAERPRTLKGYREKKRSHRPFLRVVVVTKDLVMMLRTYFYLFRLQ